MAIFITTQNCFITCTLLTYDQQGAAVTVPSNNCYTNYYSYFDDPFYFLYFYYNYYYYYIFYYSYYCYIYYYSYFFYYGYISYYHYYLLYIYINILTFSP